MLAAVHKSGFLCTPVEMLHVEHTPYLAIMASISVWGIGPQEEPVERASPNAPRGAFSMSRTGDGCDRQINSTLPCLFGLGLAWVTTCGELSLNAGHFIDFGSGIACPYR
jgi:hypothetical protein